jgi:hypothetical protein
MQHETNPFIKMEKEKLSARQKAELRAIKLSRVMHGFPFLMAVVPGVKPTFARLQSNRFTERSDGRSLCERAS